MEHEETMHDTGRYIEYLEKNKPEWLPPFYASYRAHNPELAPRYFSGIISELGAKKFMMELGCDVRRSHPLADVALGVDYLADNPATKQTYAISVKTGLDVWKKELEKKKEVLTMKREEELAFNPEVYLVFEDFLTYLRQFSNLDKDNDVKDLKRFSKSVEVINKKSPYSVIPLVLSMPPLRRIGGKLNKTTLMPTPKLLMSWHGIQLPIKK